MIIKLVNNIEISLENIFITPHFGSNEYSTWLPRLDSNQDKQLQRLPCYHYTTGQKGSTNQITKLLTASTVFKVSFSSYSL